MIELLVVIAIIGILASLLLPALQQAKEKARLATCVNNLKQVVMGTNLYCDDYDGTFPAYSQPPTPLYYPRLWGSYPNDFRGQYVSSWEVFQCPSVPPFTWFYQTCYCISSWINNHDGGGGYRQVWFYRPSLPWEGREKRDRIKLPSAAALHGHSTNGFWYDVLSPDDRNPWAGNYTYCPHGGLTAMAFVDGHAGAMNRMKYIQLLTLRSVVADCWANAESRSLWLGEP